MTTSLGNLAVVTYYDRAHAAGTDKQYPTVNYVRLEQLYFGRKPGRMLDYGFGVGANLIHFLEKGYDVDALDTSPNAKQNVLRKLAARPAIAARANLQVMDPSAARLPFADATFDYVLCVSVLSLLSTADRIKAMIAEFSRVLKPGGKAILDVNGPAGEFGTFGKSIGGNQVEFRGVKGKSDPILCYCPQSAEAFADMIRPYLHVDEVGFTAHKFFDSVEQEFIVCAHKH